MKFSVVTLFLCCLFAATSAATDHDGLRLYPTAVPNGSSFPAVSVVRGTEQVDLHDLVADKPTILIRFLGYSCQHCVEQLTYLNRHADRLRELGVRVIAFSSDDPATCERLMQRMKYDRHVFTILSDVDDAAARSLKLIQDERDLHGVFVIKNGVIALSIYSEQPYMDIERLVAEAAPMVVASTPHAVDRYLTQPFTIETIAGPSDGINAPIDLDFNKSPLHPNDLWVVTTDRPGHAMAIIHNATDASQRAIRLKKDSRASHFMWRTLGIAMGSNGAFATAQNGENGGGDPFYQFMGPTLWSSDTAVFASRYQDDRRILASHLDMLHQSPMGLGIAHDHDNVYWVSCGYYGDITRYDFQDPHEVGGTDHRDGIIRRYPQATLSRGERGRPAHMALDHSTGWLYYVDPGTNTVSRLQTRTGVSDTMLTPPEESAEYLLEYTGWEGASVEAYLGEPLGEPVGIEIVDDRLLVGDRTSGKIFVYAITPTGPERLGAIDTKATELLGICVGPDGAIWFVDRGAATVQRLAFDVEPRLVPHHDVMVVDRHDTLRMTYHNATGTDRTATFTSFTRSLDERGEGEWIEAGGRFEFNVSASGGTEITFDIAVFDTLAASEFMIQEVNTDGTYGVRANTIVVPRAIKRVLVEDATSETFRISDALDQTERLDYARLRSDLFVRVADSLPKLQTVLWNGGSFGEISITDDAILMSLLTRKIEIFLIADDPLLLRTDLPNSLNFFNAFGASIRGADTDPATSSANGQRLFAGIPGDSVSGGLALIDCQLPRLNHHRGGDFVPNVYFTERDGQGAATGILTRTVDGDTRIGAIRFEHPNYRSIVLGINASRFLGGEQRTTLLRQGLIWLEAASEPEIVDTVTSVEETSDVQPISLIARANPIMDVLAFDVIGTAASADVGLYSVAGQRLASLYEGELNGTLDISHSVSTLAAGTYFVIVRTPTDVTHLTIVKR